MSPDFKDLLSAFNAHGVDYLVVGAHALAAHGRVRATGDLDVWVRPDEENARRVIKALTAFGAPLENLSASDLAQPGVLFQIGVAPFAGEKVSVLSARHLIVNKRAVGRPQDLADLDWLEKNRKK